MLEWIILILNLIIIFILVVPGLSKKKIEKYSIFTDMIENISRTVDAEATPQILSGISPDNEEDPCKTIKPIIANRQKELRNLLKIASDLECKME